MVSLHGKNLVWVFALCIWDMTRLLHSCFGVKEHISLNFHPVPWFAPIPLLQLLLLSHTTHVFHSPLTLLSYSSRENHHPDPARSRDSWSRPRRCSQAHRAGPWFHDHHLPVDIRNDEWGFPLVMQQPQKGLETETTMTATLIHQRQAKCPQRKKKFYMEVVKWLLCSVQRTVLPQLCGQTHNG